MVSCVVGEAVLVVADCVDVLRTPWEGTVVTVVQCFAKADVTHHQTAVARSQRRDEICNM